MNRRCLVHMLSLFTLICAQQDGAKLMKIYDYDRSKTIERVELIDILHDLEISNDLNQKTLESLLAHVFKIYDKDSNDSFDMIEFSVFAGDMRSRDQRGESPDDPAHLHGAAMKLYEKGGDFNQLSKVAVLFKSAADRGHAPSQHSLGAMYYSGEGVDRDEIEAIKYFRLAAHQGYIHSMYNLGVILYSRRKFSTRNSKQGDVLSDKAWKQMGDLWKWINGEMNEPDRELEINEALDWLKKAAEAGSYHAQVKLEEHHAKYAQDAEAAAAEINDQLSDDLEEEL